MPQLAAAEGETAECAGHAERHTYRLRPVPPRVPRGMSGNSPAPAEGGTPSGLPARRQRYIDGNTELHLAIMGKMPMERQPTMESFSFSSLRPCAFALICCSILASSASAGYPPETEGLPAKARFRLKTGGASSKLICVRRRRKREEPPGERNGLLMRKGRGSLRRRSLRKR